MNTPEDYLRRADEAERKAAKLTDPFLRRTYRAIAEHWRAIARAAMSLELWRARDT